MKHFQSTMMYSTINTEANKINKSMYSTINTEANKINKSMYSTINTEATNKVSKQKQIISINILIITLFIDVYWTNDLYRSKKENLHG